MAWILPVLLFVVLRFPAMVHQPGMQDEQWFAVPGLTVWQEGVPRIPYVPTRQRDTFFENADVCLMALPPGLFYVQAPFFGMFKAGYPTARIPLFLGAMIAIGITYQITRRLGGSVLTSGAAATLVALSRPLLFTGLTTRPDLLCILLGWFAMLVLWKQWSNDRLRGSLYVGALCGLGGLFHPFALVFCIQAGIGTLLKSVSWNRMILHVICLAGSAIAVISFWLPLILRFPAEFQSQFYANVLDRAGPGLLSRLLSPTDSLIHHTKLLIEFAGVWQFGMMAFGLIAGSFLLWRRRSKSNSFKLESVGYIALAWSSVYLTATVAGLHPTKGYWIYSFVWLIPLLMVSLQSAAAYFSKSLGCRDGLVWGCSAVSFAVVLLMMIPGAGLRSTRLYYLNWRDPSLHASTFIQGVLNDLPKKGIFYADLSYVFDVYLSGRQTRLCQEKKQYWGDEELDYEYLILSWEGEDANWAPQYDARFVRRIGDRQYEQSCFVDLYQSPRSP
jgi:hypothetical protein